MEIAQDSSSEVIVEWREEYASPAPTNSEIVSQERLPNLLRQAVDAVASKYVDRHLAPSVVFFIIVDLVHDYDPSFSEALIKVEFGKYAPDYSEQLDLVTRGRFSMSHIWKT
ncbi:MAG: hypothetical protein ACXVIG_01000 [Halobacteriota archaeon]